MTFDLKLKVYNCDLFHGSLIFYALIFTLTGIIHLVLPKFDPKINVDPYDLNFMVQSLYPPQTLFVGGILFSRCPSVRASVRPSVRNALFP